MSVTIAGAWQPPLPASCQREPLPSGRGPLPTHLELVKQFLRGCGDRGDSLVERLGVMAGRRPEAADLADVLERGGPDVGVGDLLGVGLAECLNAAAHATTVRHYPVSRDF